MSAGDHGHQSEGPIFKFQTNHNIYYLQAVNQKSVSDAEKREKFIVIKKLEGLEQELKVKPSLG